MPWNFDFKFKKVDCLLVKNQLELGLNEMLIILCILSSCTSGACSPKLIMREAKQLASLIDSFDPISSKSIVRKEPKEKHIRESFVKSFDVFQPKSTQSPTSTFQRATQLPKGSITNNQKIPNTSSF